MNADRASAADTSGVALRAYPPPCLAAFTICSDLDETPHEHDAYFEIARYLNTRQETAMGPGVGLEIGNSIYFDMPTNQFAYRTTDDRGRERIRTLIRSGHIDVLHSYGDFASTRAHCAAAIDELNKHDCKLRVWVDHSKAPSNFGPDIMCGRGDLPGEDVYHADLTRAYGVRFIWRGRTTGVNGQDVPIGPRAISHLWDPRHPLASAKVAAKECVKLHLGRRPHPRWEMYTANRVLRESTFRDGAPTWEFLRSNPYWGGSGLGDTAGGIAQVLTSRMLDRLVQTRGVCVLYTHLGKCDDPRRPFPAASCEAFERLAARARDGRLFVTTTSRLLQYLAVRDTLRYRVIREPQATRIVIDSIGEPGGVRRMPTDTELQGITFELPSGGGRVIVERSTGGELQTRITEADGKRLVAIPWQRLQFPDL
ncbi:MAG: hypothetical protein SF069_12810 [Phycisphaerae bacterium]|nr:hypothetical protein [Phycisphaerae bacterium]